MNQKEVDKRGQSGEKNGARALQGQVQQVQKALHLKNLRAFLNFKTSQCGCSLRNKGQWLGMGSWGP